MRDTASLIGSFDQAMPRRFGAAEYPCPADALPPADATHAVEARPYRHARPLVFFFASAAAACAFADDIRGWPGPRPLVARILRGRFAAGDRQWIGEGATALAVEEIIVEDGRPWC